LSETATIQALVRSTFPEYGPARRSSPRRPTVRSVRSSRLLTVLAAATAFVVSWAGASAAARGAPTASPGASADAAQQASYNRLALTPPMGFNNWAGFECNSQFGEQLFVKTADAIVNLGLNKLGYDYVNIDDCWMQRDRDANGNLQVDTTRFPHG